MAELAPAEDAARRRLLFGYLEHFPTDAAGMTEFEKYLDDLSSRRKEVLNPYGRPTKRLAEPSSNPFTIAAGAVQNPQTTQPKKSNAGRKRGTKNKEGHNAGGDRKSAEFWAGKKARTAAAGSSGRGSFTSRSSGDDGGGGLDEDEGGGGVDDDDGSGAGAGEERSSIGDGTPEGEDQRKAADRKESRKDAVERLRMYAASFPNGAFDSPVDCDSDSDDGVGDDDEAGGDEAGGASRNFTARKYLPVDGSPVGEYLSTVRARVMSKAIDVGKTTWIPPPTQPVMQSLGATATPNNFYLGKVWVFLWVPMVQYAGKMPRKYECPCCKSKNTRINNWFWRPFHWWDQTVYVLHQQIRCYENGCNACFPTVHRSVLATLPTHVGERFPFVCPTNRGPGYYGPMLLTLIALMPHSVQSGAFARALNVVKRFNFALMHISYLDEVDPRGILVAIVGQGQGLRRSVGAGGGPF